MDLMIMKSNYSWLYGAGKATHDLTNCFKVKNIRVKKLVYWTAVTLNLNKQNYNVGPDYFFTEKKDILGLAMLN